MLQTRCLSAYYILEHCFGGCHDTKGLFEQIQQFGYTGSYDTVARYTRRLRFSQGIPLRERLIKKPLPFTHEPSKRIFTRLIPILREDAPNYVKL